MATTSEEQSTNNAGKTLTDTYILPRSILDESPGSVFFVYMMLSTWWAWWSWCHLCCMQWGFKARIDENSWNGANGMQLWNEITLKKIACLKDRCKKAGMSSLSFSWELGIYYSFNFGFEHNLVWYYDMMCGFSLIAAKWRNIANTFLSIWHALSVVHKAMVAWTQFNHFQFQANNRNHP